MILEEEACKEEKEGIYDIIGGKPGVRREDNADEGFRSKYTRSVDSNYSCG